MTVSLKDPVVLDIAIAKGDLTIAYSREGQVTVYAYEKEADGDYVPRNLVETHLRIDQTENHVTIRDSPNAPHLEKSTVAYRIDVPWWTEVSSTITGTGKQVIVGITGPARVVSGAGDIEANWIRFGLFEASTGRGKITCTRVIQLDVETRSGNIALLENGPSVATVKQGTGMIEIGGARGTVKAGTDKGSIHIKAVNWEDWELTSGSGNIQIAVPSDAKFQADLATDSGEIEVWRSDMEDPKEGAHRHIQAANGGGKRIQARSTSGNISIE